MPIEASAFQLPSGARVVRADCIGTISKEDADGWLRQLAPGGPFHGHSILADTLRIGHVDPEARNAFANSRKTTQSDGWIAVIVTNPVIRVTTNFVMRITRNQKQRLFQTEGEAVAWLDERVREGSAHAPAP